MTTQHKLANRAVLAWRTINASVSNVQYNTQSLPVTSSGLQHNYLQRQDVNHRQSDMELKACGTLLSEGGMLLNGHTAAPWLLSAAGPYVTLQHAKCQRFHRLHWQRQQQNGHRQVRVAATAAPLNCLWTP